MPMGEEASLAFLVARAELAAAGIASAVADTQRRLAAAKSRANWLSLLPKSPPGS